ncbi:uncharacterized protein LOC110733582 [Chenopodium quinoa]|uniref:uncharacterized protein LOC110733582 n=1 Tax=Chenopodium quinoa TaxID=63459 RepID=UPI000B78CB77|nr:uncharacterized protein LOC110733582 [Chenopodium quinoa]
MADEGNVHKEESAMNELMKQAEEAKSHDDLIFGGWFYNKSTHTPMHLHAEKIWSGDFYHKYSEIFAESTGFTQSVKKDKGIIKSAVVYSIKTSEDQSNHYAFLLAWSHFYVNEERRTSKAYGYCGLLEKFQNIDWDKVEKDLDASTSSCSYIDAYTRTSVKAEIYANVVYADFS